jgi:molybdate transport system substrate-binding protein
VTDVANDLKLGTVDAGIVWDAMLRQREYEGLERVPVPELEAREARVEAVVLTCSNQPEAAQEFARFLAAPDGGRLQFEKLGFK